MIESIKKAIALPSYFILAMFGLIDFDMPYEKFVSLILGGN